MCEALWQPDMSPEEIFECIAQALTNALDRDASSGKYKNIQIFKKKYIYIFQFLFLIFFSILGWGAVVHIIEADKITTKKIKTRMD